MMHRTMSLKFLQHSSYMCNGWLHSIKILMFPVLKSYRKFQSRYCAYTRRSKCKLLNHTWPLNLYGINSGIRNFIYRQILEKETCYMYVIPAVMVCKHKGDRALIWTVFRLLRSETCSEFSISRTFNCVKFIKILTFFYFTHLTNIYWICNT